jgi:hypothetical protein
MSKSDNTKTEGKEKRAEHLRKLNLPKNKQKFNFTQWESQHREGWDDDADEFGIHDDEYKRRR